MVSVVNWSCNICTQYTSKFPPYAHSFSAENRQKCFLSTAKTWRDSTKRNCKCRCVGFFERIEAACNMHGTSKLFGTKQNNFTQLKVVLCAFYLGCDGHIFLLVSRRDQFTLVYSNRKTEHRVRTFFHKSCYERFEWHASRFSRTNDSIWINRFVYSSSAINFSELRYDLRRQVKFIDFNCNMSERYLHFYFIASITVTITIGITEFDDISLDEISEFVAITRAADNIPS